MFLIHALKSSLEHVDGLLRRVIVMALLIAVLCSCIEIDADDEVSDDE